MKTVSKINLFW